MKTLADLINTADPAWPLIQEWLAEAANPVEILPRDPAAAEAELVKTQVSTRSVMGAVVYETGGILIDHGWLRILGSGTDAFARQVHDDLHEFSANLRQSAVDKGAALRTRVAEAKAKAAAEREAEENVSSTRPNSSPEASSEPQAYVP